MAAVAGRFRSFGAVDTAEPAIAGGVGSEGELDLAFALCGCPDVAAVTRDLVMP